MTDTENTGPLRGLKILDMTRVLAGPTATQLLGDMGADVVKVERPGPGDDTRAWGPPWVEDKDGNTTAESGYYLSANRNKRSIGVNITTSEGAETVLKLAAKADVFMENFKKDGLKKYGLSYDDLKALNPGIIYCSITGFGQTGPNAHRAGYDLMIQGYSGLMSVTGPEGSPHKVGVAIADLMTGMYAVVGVQAALRHRDETGEGQHIDIALADTQVAGLINQGVNHMLTGKVPVSAGNGHSNIVPYEVFPTSDSHIIIAVGNDTQFAAFADILGRSDLAENEMFNTNPQRVRNRAEIIAILRELIAAHKRDDLMGLCEARGVPAGPVHDLADVFNTNQVAAREMVVNMDFPTAGDGSVDLIANPLKFSKTPVSYRHAPPLCGADTEDVLKDWLDED